MAFPNDQRPPRPRTVNQVNRDVAQIIEHTLSQFDHWRDRTFMLQAAVERNGADRKAILKECKAMRSQIVEAKTAARRRLRKTTNAPTGQITESC